MGRFEGDCSKKWFSRFLRTILRGGFWVTGSTFYSPDAPGTDLILPLGPLPRPKPSDHSILISLASNRAFHSHRVELPRSQNFSSSSSSLLSKRLSDNASRRSNAVASCTSHISTAEVCTRTRFNNYHSDPNLGALLVQSWINME